MAKIVYAPQAADKLLEKIEEYSLNRSQVNEINKLLASIEKNPLIGVENNDPLGTKFAIEKHIGKKLWIILHYDIERASNISTVKIKGLFIGYKM